MKKLIGISLLSLFILTGCDNDDEKNVELTSDEAKALVNNSADKIGDDVVSLIESDGTQAIMDFADLLENSAVIGGRVSEKAWTKEKLDLIIQYFVDGPAARVSNDDPMTFDDIKGLYEWNPETQDFDKEASEFFIVKFPTEGSQTNNAELKISQLEFVTIREVHADYVDEYELPTVIVGYVKVDDVTVIELDFSANWSSTGAPEKADVSLFVTPFTFQLDFDDTFDKSSLVSSSMLLGEESILAVDLTVEFETADKEEPVYFEGSVSYRDIKIAGNVDVRDIEDDADPNDFIDLALFAGDEKVGDIVFVLEEIEPGFEDYVPYVEYEDGSRDNLEDLLEPVIEDMEEFFAQFEEEDEF
ncbi:hypothetical protein [Ekhidna sp.]|uniref:hypothetical protein n=1 Tax=Ekhidna sp. TaxID=2608089 RepID=UPI003B508D2F